MRISGATAVYALLGRPVRHSRSPAIHNALFARHRIDAVYVCLEPEGPPLRPVLRSLAGANLTVPFKTVARDELDALTPIARAVGAVNTVFRRGDRLVGDNTDADGFVRGLQEAFGAVRPERAVILGAGGAARAVAAGLAFAGTLEITLLNRTVEAAERVATELDGLGGARFGAGPLAGALAADLVVNATSGGARALVEALDLRDLPPDAIGCDLNYWDAEPPLLAACRARGLRTLDGLPMLRHQALLAFERFTGVIPDASVLT